MQSLNWSEMRICTGDGSQKPRESDRAQGPKWKVKARANHILRKGKMNQESSLRMRRNGPGEREGRKSSRPQWSERRANKIAVSSSERHEETKQFGIKNDLTEWLRTWVGSGLGRLYLGTPSRWGEQLYGSRTQTQLNSGVALGSERFCGSSDGGHQS